MLTVVEYTFVFADLAGYTALTEAHGDEDAAQVATRFHSLAARALPAGCRIVKTMGDAVMVVAPSIEDGIASAFRIADAVASEERFPGVRIGIHSGPAVCRDGDYFGAAVNVAARVTAVACAGDVVCTESVAACALARQLAPARPMGAARLKNVAAPVALFQLRASALAGRLECVDPVCRMHIDPAAAAATLEQPGGLLYFCSTACLRRFQLDPLPVAEPAVANKPS